MNKRRGFVLITALGLVFVVSMLTAIALMVGVGNRQNASKNLRVTQGQQAAEAGLDLGVVKLWQEIWGNQNPTSMVTYATRLDLTDFKDSNIGVTKTYPTQKLGNDASYELKITRRANDNQFFVFDLVSKGTLPDGTIRILNQRFRIGNEKFKGFDYALLTNNVNCIFCHTSVLDMATLNNDPSSTAPIDKVKVGVLEHLELRPDWKQGQQHNYVDTVIGGTVHLRGDFMDESGNDLTKPQNQTVSVNGVNTVVSRSMNDLSLKTLMSPGTPNIVDRTLKTPSPVDCVTAANCDISTKPNQNFYVNYPKEKDVNDKLSGNWPDGELPNGFPLPIEDANGNRIIDDGEWDAEVNESNAGKNPQNKASTITGGRISTYGATSGSFKTWPTGGNATSITNTLSGTKQNVVLDGSSSTLDLGKGNIYVNGDVIIRGKIKGEGRIVARGNIYIMGDVVYDCGASACDYSKPETLPKFAMVAGKNVIAGDFLTGRGQNLSAPLVTQNITVTRDNGTQYTEAVTNYSTIDEGNRAGHRSEKKRGYGVKRVQQVVNGKPQFDKNGNPIMVDLEVQLVKNGVPQTSNGTPVMVKVTDLNAPQFDGSISFAMREMTLFNRSEMYKAIKNPTYTPRFYRLGKNDPVYFWNNTSGEGTDDIFSDSLVELTPNSSKPYAKANGTQPNSIRIRYELDTKDVNGKHQISGNDSTSDFSQTQLQAIMNRAVLVESSADNDWITRDDLKTLWVDSIECGKHNKPCTKRWRSDSRTKGALRTDGMIYSANGMFALARKASQSDLEGQWDLRGSMVAADTGALITGKDPGSVNNDTNPLLTEGWNSKDPKSEKSFSLYYDKRMKDFYNIKGQDSPSLTRSRWTVGVQ